jgi:magnesium transporter
VDADGKLVGVVEAEAVEEAAGERAEVQMRSMGGIVAGEEIRSMKWTSRSARRLLYLVPNIGLNLLSISIIALFVDTIDRVVELAIFLPLVVGICGNGGNQALAVTMRELSLGLVKPVDALRVFSKEVWLGLWNGLIIGTILFFVAWAWNGNPWLGLVVGGAVPLTTAVATTSGGVMPLLLQRLKIDPALASGPILTTATDLFGFLAVLGGAWALLAYLVPA